MLNMCFCEIDSDIWMFWEMIIIVICVVGCFCRKLYDVEVVFIWFIGLLCKYILMLLNKENLLC